MAFNFNISWQKPLSVTRDVTGNWFYEVFSSVKSRRKTNIERLNMVRTNPALASIFINNADIFSSGKVIQGKDNNNFLESYMSKPNIWQNWNQFFWDYMYYIQGGTVYQYYDKSSMSIMFLDPSRIIWGKSLLDKIKTFILSRKSYNEIIKGTIDYSNEDGTVIQIPLKDVKVYFDVSNAGNKNKFEGISRLECLDKVVYNIEKALDSKSSNLEYSEKFFVSGVKKTQTVGLDSIPMGDTEKESIESAINGGKKLHATKSPLELKRFVDDLAKLKLGDSIKDDFSMIASVYNFPKELLAIFQDGVTYENQEKAIGRHISQFHYPKGVLLMEGLMETLGLKDLKYSFEHLPYNQVFEIDRQTVLSLKLDNEIKAKQNGIEIK